MIILPDLRRGYTPAFEKYSAQDVVGWFFHGLSTDPLVEIVGVKKEDEGFVWTLDHINDLSPKELAEAFERVLSLSSSPHETQL